MTGRRRSACDSCHQSKIRCSGGDPCTACEASASPCEYSTGSRLGRPKGSKNKRKSSDTKRAGAQAQSGKDSGEDNSESSQQWAMDLDLDSAIQAALDADLAAVHSPDFLHNSSLNVSLNTLATEPMPTSPTYDFGTHFSHFANTLSKATPYRALPSTDSDSSLYNGDHTSNSMGSSISHRLSISTPPSVMSTLGNSAGDTQAPWPPSESPSCSCLSKLTRLLYQLGDLQFPAGEGPSVDRILQGVRMAQGPWQHMKQCPRCQCDEQEEVFLLFAMSIRVLLSAVHALNAGSIPDDTGIPMSPLATLKTGVSIGSFELAGDTKAHVINLAIKGALQDIACALVYLWECTDRTRRQTGGNPRDRNGVPDSPFTVLNRLSSELQKQLPQSSNAFTLDTMFTEDIGTLLNTLQSAMGQMQNDLN